ncbi:MAG: DUF3084 domain-containing protein [Bacillota bacterium]|nr:DUF3084 domain-containing protein [Bacillota bacterium]
MYGLRLVLVLIFTGGIIAYIGDQIGRRVGRRRLSLLGLRPRYTSIVITVITGVLIAAANLAILSAVSEDVRTALFSMKQLQLALSRSQLELKVQKEELSETRAVAERLEAERRQAELSLERAQKDLVTARQELNFLRGRVRQLKELAEPLAEAVENLRREVADLTKEKARLEAEVGQLQTDLYFGNVAFRADEIVAATVLTGGRPAAEVKKDLLRFLNGPANQAALRRGARIEGKETALQIVPEHLEEASALISSTQGKVVVRAVAWTNTLTGEPVPVYFQLFRNEKIFRAGEVVAERKVDAAQPPDRLLMDVLGLLGEVNQRAIQLGMVTTPEGTVGQTATWTEIPEAIRLIQERGGVVTLKAVAVADTWSAEGPLQVRLEVGGESASN